MKTALHTFGTLAITAAFSFGAVNIASAQAQHRGGQVTIPASSTERNGDIGLRAHTNIKLFTPTGGMPKASAAVASGPPFAGYLFETPASLACIYNLVPQSAGCDPNTVRAVPTGGSTAIAIVDAYDNPGAAKDLAKFSKQFGLPPAAFQVVFATGTRPYNDPGWEIEESLDVQWAHAMAPTAKLYLVEAATNSFYDLLTAETVAASIVASEGGGVVSNSWGGSEFVDETAYDSFFSYPGVVYVASAGDGPGVLYPSASPYVVAVGGTTLSRSANGAYIFESAWNSTGGGLSQYESIPPYQKGVTKVVGTQRGVPDVSAEADPNSGVWVLDSGNGGWYIVGGTSASAPIWAGIVSAAGINSGSSAAELTTIYKNRGNKLDFNDIKSGVCGPWNGNLTQPGYDLCTGVGSPVGYGAK
ncbi:MAG: S53 family peptidase [Candidatus Sulfotelmatobacter sp.]